jgi:tRNA(His) guanylyltransferase
MNDLGTRIKSYEKVYDQYLTPNSCVFIRVDGKAFHTYTKAFNRPFDDDLISSMNYAAIKTAEQMQGFKLAYGQSDEYTFCITDFETHETQGWFGYRLNKLVSITASMFTAYFNHEMSYVNRFTEKTNKLAFFDARAFVVPIEDAPNVFVWRQKDWYRNSVQMLAQSLYSHKQLHGKNMADLHDMIVDAGHNWNNLEDWQKNGTWLDKDCQAVYDKKNYDQIKELII